MKSEGMSCDEIEKKTGLDIEWVSHHVENLEAKGLVEIKREIKDKKPVRKVYPKDLGYMDTINFEEWDEEDLKLFSRWERVPTAMPTPKTQHKEKKFKNVLGGRFFYSLQRTRSSQSSDNKIENKL